MRTVPFNGSIEEYQGKPVNPPIQYSGSVDQYETVAEAQASEDWPSANETLKIVNAKKLAGAKSTEYQKATKELKDAYEKSPEFKHAQLVKALSALHPSKSTAQIEALAVSMEAA